MLKRTSLLKRLFILCCGKGRHQLLRTSLFCIFLSLLAGAILLLLLGKNPLEAYTSILQGAGILPKSRYAGRKSQLTDFMSLLNYTTPMVFAALSVAVALKCGIFNICVSGIMVFSGFMATVLVGYSNIDPFLAKILVVLIGALSGALIGILIGYLKHRFNMNEVVVAIMLNYIISYVVSFFIQTRFIDPITRQSVAVGQNARLTLFDHPVGNLKMESFISACPARGLCHQVHARPHPVRLRVEGGGKQQQGQQVCRNPCRQSSGFHHAHQRLIGRSCRGFLLPGKQRLHTTQGASLPGIRRNRSGLAGKHHPHRQFLCLVVGHGFRLRTTYMSSR